MPTAAFTTLGCKVNQYETQKILESFEACGFEVVPFEGPADVYVVNSCSVTSDAERKSRYTIRRATRHNPEARVIVTGCAAQMSEIRGEQMEGADLMVPNPRKLDTIQYFAEAFPGEVPVWPPRDAGVTKVGSAFANRTRATLKVQDGCSVYCSYCSIPYTRPEMVSRPVGDVLHEAKTLTDAGFSEIILTGVLIGSYGPENGSGGPNFVEMVRRVATESGAARIRISSIEMQQVSPEFIGLIEEGLVVPHLHIPLQSGDSGVLSDMNRPYDQGDYIRLCHSIQRRIPDISLTTDIMVGFPTESEERFQSSLHVCEEVGFLKAHVFSFSPRYGTPADQWGDPVTPQEKADRRQRLVAASEATGVKHTARFVGRTMRVLLEGKVGRDALLEGLTDNYLSVKLAGSAGLCRSLQWVRLDEVQGKTLFGELAAGPEADRLRLAMV